MRTTADRGADRIPVRGLTVLHDAECPLCTFVRDWLGRQRQLVPLAFVPAGSPAARARYPSLDHAATLSEITVIGDGGQVYKGSAAWVVCLWALAEYRPASHRFSTPAGARLAKAAVLSAARYRRSTRERTAREVRERGGGVYHGGDGWSYDPARGRHFQEPPPPCGGSCPAPDRYRDRH